MDPFIGQIVMFAGNYAPRNWAFCEGQIMSISSNAALFSILGTTYGGDGRVTFALPDLRGRVSIQPGNAPGLNYYRLGQSGGVESVVLTTAEIPSHTHMAQMQEQPISIAVNASDDEGDSDDPTDAFWAKNSSGNEIYGSSGGTQMSSGAVTASMPQAQITVNQTGGSQAHTNIQPYLCINHIIALQGIYPSRS